MTEAHGDEEAVATLGRFRDFTQAALGPRDVLVKTIGDAVMLAFFEPAHAVLALRRLFQSVSADPSMPLVRAGAHHGSAIAEGDDFFGSTVNLAARVAAYAGGGQLLVTEEVALTATGTGEVVTHVGAMSLRNIAQPVDLYEIELNPGARRGDRSGLRNEGSDKRSIGRPPRLRRSRRLVLRTPMPFPLRRPLRTPSPVGRTLVAAAGGRFIAHATPTIR